MAEYLNLKPDVALRKESVDRNFDRNKGFNTDDAVALRKESVDRNAYVSYS